jgi:hypothetical protein
MSVNGQKGVHGETPTISGVRFTAAWINYHTGGETCLLSLTMKNRQKSRSSVSEGPAETPSTT